MTTPTIDDAIAQANTLLATEQILARPSVTRVSTLKAAANTPALQSWAAVGAYNVQTVVAGLPFRGTAPNTASDIASEIGAWCGAAFDYANQRMFFTAGGGHGDGYANQVIDLVAEQGFSLLRDQTPFPPDQPTPGYAPLNVQSPFLPTRGDGFYIPAGATSAVQVVPMIGKASIYFDGAPASRHTYGGECWLPTQQCVLLMSGSVWGAGGGYDSFVGWFDPVTRQWTRKADHPHPMSGLVSSYDALHDKVIYLSNGTAYWMQYDPATDTHKRLDNNAAPWTSGIGGPFMQVCCAPDGYAYAVVKSGFGGTPSQQAVGATPNSILRLKLGQSTAQPVQVVQTTGDPTIMNSASPGMEYDPERNALVFFDARTPGAVAILNLSTFALTTQAITPVAGSASSTNGVWGKFRRYAPNKYVMVADAGTAPSLITLT